MRTATAAFEFSPDEARDDHGRWTGGGGDGDSPATSAVRDLAGSYGRAQPTWEEAKAAVAEASKGTPYGTKDPAVHAASTTTDHPDTFWHSTKTTNRDSIQASGLEAGRSLGGRMTRIYLDSENPHETPRSDTAPRDTWEVDTRGLPLRPDPELPGRWAISEKDIPADRVKLISTTHPDGLP